MDPVAYALAVKAAGDVVPAGGGTTVTISGMSVATLGRAGGTASDGLWHLAGGHLGNNPNTVYATHDAYDPTAGTWTTKAPLPFLRARAVGVTIGGYFHVIGGVNSGAQSSARQEHYRYDSTSNTWATRAPYPGAGGVYNTGAAVIDANSFVIAGGMHAGGNGTTLTYQYHQATDTWDAKADLPAARYSSGVVGLKGNAHVMGGNDESQARTSTNYSLDPVANLWTSKAVTPGGTRSEAVAAADDADNGYLLGGTLGGGYTAKVDRYDLAGNKWTAAIAQLPDAQEAHSGARIGSEVFLVVNTSSTNPAEYRHVLPSKPASLKTLLAYLAAK